MFSQNNTVYLVASKQYLVLYLSQYKTMNFTLSLGYLIFVSVYIETVPPALPLVVNSRHRHDSHLVEENGDTGGKVAFRW